MKVTLLLTLITTLNVSAVLYSQNTKLNLSFNDESLIDVIRTIEQKSNYRFFFSDNYQDLSNLVSINVKEENIDNILTDLFRDKAITYKVLENNIIVITPTNSQTQQQKITGTVTDAMTGEALPGANIIIEGTAIGVTTDLNGNYSIDIPDQNAVLVFSYVGYLSERFTVGGQTVINVVLTPDITALSEVVVIGYGTLRREAVTGSVATIRGDEMREVASSNVSQAMQGRIAGVEMTQTNSKPGAAMQIRIRGARSLTATNDPLVVLDGIPFAGSLNDIDPNSIKSIDILKDASATAIYGSRGANGVILITTNRGQKGQQAKISYNAYYGVKNAIKYPMMDGPQFLQLRTEALRTVTELGRGVAFDAASDEQNDINTDWQDLLYRQGSVNSHDLSISNGTETGNYIFSVGYLNDEAVLPTQGYDRYSIRAALDQEVGKYFRFGLTSNNSYGVSTGNQVGVADALGASPLASPYEDNGDLKRATFSSTQGDPYKVWTKESVEAVKDQWLSDSKALGTYNSLYGEVEAPWVEGLKYRINLGLNYRSVSGGNYTGIGVTSATNPNEPSTASLNHELTTNWTVENLITFDRTFAEKHQVNIVGLYSSEQTTYNRSVVNARDLPAGGFQYFRPDLAQGEITLNLSNNDLQNGAKYYWTSGLISWMGRVMYSYDNRYMLSATLRSDGSSRLAPGHKWHTYPAVSAGWNIAKESFMQNISQINLMKLRVGYGQTSNQAIDPYSTLGLLDTRYYNFGDNGTDSYTTGYFISQLPNVNLGWEYTKTWNYAIDFGLFAGRLSGTIEYYTQHTNDILLSVNLPPTTGVNSYTANIGETENKGFEFSLNGIIINNPNGLTWEAGINLYANRNKLVALTSGSDENRDNWWFVGHPIDVIFDYKKLGLWQEGDPYLDILEPAGNVGMIKVEYTGEYDETTGEPTREIGDDDRQPLDIEPNFQGGFNTRLAYKGFDLSIVGTFKSGGTIISTLYGTSGFLNLMTGRHNNVDVDYWTPENTGADYPRPGGANVSDNPKYASTLAYFDASYLKIRTISLGYNFTKAAWMGRTGISQLRLYVTAQNPLVLFSPFHKESGLDPEPNSLGNENQAINTTYQRRLPVVANNTPSTRNYLIGINITF
ncbi:MAG: SusC/RagA family TonB-linked outer membrane protein [Bacteroidales bacterium]|nr:SusC/RagA family TonB-linked outer membrane protein [Bacteroidales bacterium]